MGRWMDLHLRPPPANGTELLQQWQANQLYWSTYWENVTQNYRQKIQQERELRSRPASTGCVTNPRSICKWIIALMVATSAFTTMHLPQYEQY
jgi:hypothetical protein